MRSGATLRSAIRSEGGATPSTTIPSVPPQLLQNDTYRPAIPCSHPNATLLRRDLDDDDAKSRYNTLLPKLFSAYAGDVTGGKFRVFQNATSWNPSATHFVENIDWFW